MLRIFDPHIHMFSRVTDDYERMHAAGVRVGLEPAFWLGQSRTNVGSFIDYFDTLIGWERHRAGGFGIHHLCTMALNPREANDDGLNAEVLAILPRYLEKNGVVGVGEIGLDTVPQALVNDGRNADPSGLRYRFEPSGDIDPVAINIAAVNHDVAEVDADAKHNAPALGDIGIPCRHAALDVDRAFDRVNDARELHERSIAHELDNPATMRRDGRVYQLGTVSL